MLDFMKRIGIFVICAQSLLHFCAGKGYEKYIKLLIGMMILGQFIVPVRALFLGEGEAELWRKINMFQEEMLSITDDIELPEIEESEITDSIYEEIKSKLYYSAQDAGYFISDIKINGDKKEEQLSVILVPEEAARHQVQVEEISISTSKEEEEQREERTEHTKKVRELQTEFGRLLGIDGAYIEILLEE